MSFGKVKPAGWSFGEILTSAQMNTLDEDHANAVDSRGGAYSLLAPLQFADDNIIITSTSGLVCAGDITLDGAFYGNDDVTLGSTSGDVVTVLGTPTFVAPSTFVGAATFHGNVTINGSLITVGNVGTDVLVVQANTTLQSNATFEAGLYANDDVTLGSTSGDVVTILGTTTVIQPASFIGLVTMANGAVMNAPSECNSSFSATSLVVNVSTFLAGTVSLSAILNKSGVGRILERYVIGADANTSYSPASVEFVHVPNGGISANRNYTVTDSGSDGDHIRFECNDVAFQIGITIPGPLVLSLSASLTYQVAEARRMGGVWRFSLVAHLPAP